MYLDTAAAATNIAKRETAKYFPPADELQNHLGNEQALSPPMKPEYDQPSRSNYNL